MKSRDEKIPLAEVKPKFKHFALAMLIILLFTVPFFIIVDKDVKKWNTYLKNNGIETIAFYAFTGGSMSSKSSEFEYEVNGEKYIASLPKTFELPPDYPFKEIPIMVRYAEEKPDRCIVLPDKVFIYKGFQIKWITHAESRNYYLTMKKVD